MVKPTLLSIKRTTDVTTRAIAERARLPISAVFEVEAGGYSSSENVQKVVMAFNQLSGMQVTMQDIRFHSRGGTYDHV